MRLGIVDRPGLFAAPEIFYEEKNGQAVAQGDMVVGEAATLDQNLRKELANLSRVVNANPPENLNPEDKAALKELRGLVVAVRGDEVSPDVQELIEAAARLPYESLRLNSKLEAAIDELLDSPPGQKILGQVKAADLRRLRLMLRDDPDAFEEARNNLIDLAKRATGVKLRGGPPPDTSLEFQRLAALATFAKDSLRLSEDQKKSLETLAKKAPESVKTVTGSPYVGPKIPRVVTRGYLVDDRSLYWDDGVVTYKFDPGFPEGSKGIVDRAMQDYRDNTAITFKLLGNNETATAYVVFKVTGGNLSAVGCQRREQAIELANTPQVGATIHEIGHALGLLHEHSRPDRNQFITVHFDLVKPEWQNQFREINSFRTKTLGKYDFQSIMHYPPKSSFGVQADALTMTKTDGTPLDPSVGDLGENGHLSNKDIGSLAIMYGSKP